MAKTLKDLAAELGLSQTTVSRALNGFPEVSEATRRRVEKAAERLNYRPSARARSLATGRTMAIAHILTFSDRHEMMNPVYGDFIAGASEAYQAAGYHIHLALVADVDQERVFRDLAAERSVDGVLLQAPLTGDPRIGLLDKVGLPFVVHGRASLGDDAGYSWVDVNNRKSFRAAARHLIDLGHERIALINGFETMDFARRRRDGYEAALAEAGIGTDPALMARGEMTEGNGYKEARRMLALPVPPTAILASSFIPALGVRRAVADAGLTLGRDVSLIIHDDDLSYLKNGGAAPIFTAMRSSVRAAGQIAADLLLRQISRQAPSPAHHLLEAEFIDGPSTGPCLQRLPKRETVRTA
ncbi:MAG: substrate-binding domain-containing protein [Paracoccaceae bacterium]|nr:substrate-binding domain-containing protein [Paracoccaceae bacterium]